MESYKYQARDIELSTGIRLHLYRAAQHDKRGIYEKFCQELQLEKNTKCVLPESFLIEMNAIDYLYDIRDRIITKHYKNYQIAQKLLASEVAQCENEIKIDNNLKEQEQHNLANINNKLRGVKNSDDKIALQSKKQKIASAIKNLELSIMKSYEKLRNLEKDNASNQLEWNTQISYIENTIEFGIANYLKRATKRIEKEYGFTSFTHLKASYNDDLQKIISGKN